MPQGDWERVLSLELGWMTPGQAKPFVASAVAAGLLVDEGSGIHRFVGEAATVGLGWRPDPEARAGPDTPNANPESLRAPQDEFPVLVQRLGAPDQVMAKVAQKQDLFGGRLNAAAALAWVASESGSDVQPFTRHVRAELGLAQPSNDDGHNEGADEVDAPGAPDQGQGTHEGSHGE